MWKLGKYEIKGRVVLAPMAGYTSEGYRKYLNTFGVDICVTEMVSDMGLIYNNKETNDYVIYKKDPNAITGVQLFGHDPENIAKAAQIALQLNPDIEFFDLNMGCPVPKVVKTGAGSALMKDPDLCKRIVQELKKVTNLPITAKIRLGYEEINFLDVIKALEEGGIDAIGIHARTRKEFYYGTPHFNLLKDLRKSMNVPLIVSGNIYTLDDAINALEITGAEAVMIARGGVGSPQLIKQIQTYFEKGERLPNSSFVEQKKYCLELAKSMIEEKGEKKAMMIYRAIAPKFFLGFPNIKQLRIKLATEVFFYNDLVKILDDYEKDIMNFDF